MFFRIVETLYERMIVIYCRVEFFKVRRVWKYLCYELVTIVHNVMPHCVVTHLKSMCIRGVETKIGQTFIGGCLVNSTDLEDHSSPQQFPNAD